MKHIKLFEDFSGMGMNQGNPESFVVLTGDEYGSSYAVSHIKDKSELESLKMIFSRHTDDNDGVFDAIPYTGKNYVGSSYNQSQSEIELTPYETAAAGISDGNYYEFYSDDSADRDQLPGDGEGILWKVPPVGFTLYVDKGSPRLMPNDEYINKSEGSH